MTSQSNVAIGQSGALTLTGLGASHGGDSCSNPSAHSPGHIRDLSPFPFLKLPIEIRFQVYEYVLVRRVKAYSQEGFQLLAPFEGRMDVGILRTCRQVYNESLPILYGRNQFLLNASKTSVQSFFDTIGPGKSMLRHCSLLEILPVDAVSSTTEASEGIRALISHSSGIRNLVYVRSIFTDSGWCPLPLWGHFRTYVATLANRIQHPFVKLQIFLGDTDSEDYEALKNVTVGNAEGADADAVINLSDDILSKFSSFNVQIDFAKKTLPVLEKMRIYTKSNGAWFFQKQQSQKLRDSHPDQVWVLVRIPPELEESAISTDVDILDDTDGDNENGDEDDNGRDEDDNEDEEEEEDEEYLSAEDRGIGSAGFSEGNDAHGDSLSQIKWLSEQEDQ